MQAPFAMITIASSGSLSDAPAARPGSADAAGDGSLFAALVALLTGQGAAPAPLPAVDTFTAEALPGAAGAQAASPRGATFADAAPTGAWPLPAGALPGGAAADAAPITLREALASVGDTTQGPISTGQGGVPEGDAGTITLEPDPAGGAPTTGATGEAAAGTVVAGAAAGAGATSGTEAEVLADWRKADVAAVAASTKATAAQSPPGEPASPAKAAGLTQKPGPEVAAPGGEPDAAAAPEPAAKQARTGGAAPPETAERTPGLDRAADAPRADPLQLHRPGQGGGELRPAHEAARAPDRPSEVAPGPMRVERVIRHDADRLTMVLSPPELGRVEVALHVRHGHEMRALITVDRADTLDLLQRDLASLERSLSNAGISVGSSSLQFELRQDQGRPQASAMPFGEGRVAAADEPAAEPGPPRRLASSRLVDLFA
jgi:hypothetical protein